MDLDIDTIVAISTPPGRGGIGIVRLSGPRALGISAPICRLQQPLSAGRARIAELLDEAGQVLDEAVITYFAAPRSYTGEDVVEIAAHGSPVLLEYLVRTCIQRGARLAEPGEFTQRAFLSGRIDLTQAEAVADLIDSHTLQQARVAAAQLGGSLSRTLAPIKQSLVSLIAELEAGVDFAEDDLNLLPEQEIVGRIASITELLQTLSSSYRYGRLLHDGFTMALVGRPNAGKSSLFNRLVRRDRAIVAAQPGTTRDPISERLSLSGIPVELIDTAGLRDPEATEEAEREGIRRSRTTMADADLVLHIVDATSLQPGSLDLGPMDRENQRAVRDRPHLIVVNKSDLLEAEPPPVCVDRRLFVSALTGAGIDLLKEVAIALLSEGSALGSDSTLITNLRQHQAIDRALQAILRAQQASAAGLPHEFVLLDLYAGLTPLDELTGATTPGDILNRIFGNFCIGK